MKQTKEQLLKKYFEAREKEFQLEIDYQLAQWEKEAAYKAYIDCLRAENREAAANA